ncbi:hypothetical protein [Bacillus sp. AFS059628]|uniref:hypothetical protein n=1 Tax=Bacillus sp. AFS059628 TaxID=2033508 RepID=UPI00211D2D78|nr:hypothetical protein [Bacillus sp. AFS059628]
MKGLRDQLREWKKKSNQTTKKKAKKKRKENLNGLLKKEKIMSTYYKVDKVGIV